MWSILRLQVNGNQRRVPIIGQKQDILAVQPSLIGDGIIAQDVQRRFAGGHTQESKSATHHIDSVERRQAFLWTYL